MGKNSKEVSFNMKEKKVLVCLKQSFIAMSISHFITAQPGWQVVMELTRIDKKNEEPLKDLDYDILLVDCELSIEELYRLKKILDYTSAKLVFLCNINIQYDMYRILPFKAHGYLTTNLSSTEFMNSLTKILEGDVIVSPDIVPMIVSTASNIAFHQNPRKSITPREKEIITLLASGETNKQIASTLSISENTVKNHVSNIFVKLELKNRTNLVSYAISNGLIAKS